MQGPWGAMLTFSGNAKLKGARHNLRMQGCPWESWSSLLCGLTVLADRTCIDWPGPADKRADPRRLLSVLRPVGSGSATGPPGCAGTAPLGLLWSPRMAPYSSSKKITPPFFVPLLFSSRRPRRYSARHHCKGGSASSPARASAMRRAWKAKSQTF